MIREDKFESSLYALQGVLIKARELSGQFQSNEKLTNLLDYAEHLPRLIASEDDRTDVFANTIRQIENEFGLKFVLDRYNNKAPESW